MGAPALSATSLANVPLLPVVTLLLLAEFFIECFNDCTILVYAFFSTKLLLVEAAPRRLLPSLVSPCNETLLLEEITREACETLLLPEPEKRFFAAVGRAGMPDAEAFLLVAAASAADAVTGLLWLEAMNTFFPLANPAAVLPIREVAFAEATMADIVGAVVDALKFVERVACCCVGAGDAHEPLLAVLCLGSI